jgi:hypothetical protein
MTFSSNPLISVTFGNGIETIGDYSFYSLSTLIAIDFTRATNLKTIGAGAFNYTSIVDLDLSKSTLLNTIGASAFAQADITSLSLNGTNLNIVSSSISSNKIVNLTIDGDNITIGASAFSNNYIEDLVLLDNIIGIGDDAFKNNQLPDADAFIYGRNSDGSTNTTLVSYGGARRNDITIPDTITSLTNATFSSLGLTGTLNTGNGLTTIEASKFSSNTLTSVIIGSSVTSIESRAFYSNTITSLVLGNNVQTLGDRAFAYNQIASLDLGSGLQTIGKGAFYSNKLTDIVLPDSLTTIYSSSSSSSYMTFGSNLLKSVTLGKRLEVIGDYAFYSNSNLTSIYVRGKVDVTNFASLGTSWNGTCTNIIYELSSCFTYSGGTITDYSEGCSKNADIPSTLGGNTITTIATNAFSGKSLTSASIPSTVTTIGDDAFADNSLSFIGVYGKSSSSEFSSLGSNWNDGAYIIYGNEQATCLKISNTTVTGYYTDSDVCDRNVIVPNTITAFADNAFNTSLYDSITVNDGTRISSFGTSWNGTVYKVNFLGDSYDYNCFTLSGSTITGYKKFCKANIDLSSNIVQGTNITAIGDNAFKNSAITGITLGSNITNVGVSAFEGNDIENISLVDGLVNIGNRAFYNIGLTTLTIPSTVMTIGDNAFDGNSMLTNIVVEGKISSAGFTSLGASWNGTCNNIVYNG